LIVFLPLDRVRALPGARATKARMTALLHGVVGCRDGGPFSPDWRGVNDLLIGREFDNESKARL